MDKQNTENMELELARHFIEDTGCHVFLTGKAGTGKTTFLKDLKTGSAKRMIVTAPTGVAAVNAGGVTLHSFFQLPFGPYIPGSDSFIQNKERLFRFSKEKKQIIRSLDLLVIDEISMVRADVLDAVDMVLRHHRRSSEAFGGVQLLLIGDLFQLPPVARPEDWELLRQYYQSVYFFSSHVLSQAELVTIELEKVYRQADVRFIEILNKIRANRLDADAAAALNQRVVKDIQSADDQGYITLTTHNKKADAINAAKLGALSGKPVALSADISGDFPAHNYPTFDFLTLKKNAQVMFLRNDMSPDKLYYNGKIGKVVSLSPDAVLVKCPDNDEPVLLEPVEWENIKYTIHPDTLEIKEEVLGTFRQFPLKPAWAVTIHKAQGLTFDKAVIDAGDAFAQGQVYVALSRCRSLEGLVLSTPLPSRGIPFDADISGFLSSCPSAGDLENRLNDNKIKFEQHLLTRCFDFGALNSRMGYFFSLVSRNRNLIQVSGAPNIETVPAAARTDIIEVAEKFKNQLAANYQNNRLPSENDFIRERVVKARVWFLDKINSIFDEIMNHLVIETDNKALGRKIKSSHDALRLEVTVKTAGIASCKNGFSPHDYMRAVSRAQIEFEPAKLKKTAGPVYTESDISHPQLFEQFKEWRLKIAKEKGVPAFQILHQRVLIQIIVQLPQTLQELKAISGVGPKTVSNYGDDILGQVTAYRKKHGIKEVALPETVQPPPEKTETKEKPPKPDTRQVSFDMFQKGLSPDRIAKERGLVENTVKTHLAGFVETGEIDIDRLIEPEKQAQFKKVQSNQDYSSLKMLKQKLGDNFSYGDIQLMLAHLKRMESVQKS